MATGYDPERYRVAPGAIPLRAVNIAPFHGERLVGWVPYGLSAIIAPNMAGKSRLLSALLAIALRVLKPGMVSVTKGETEALIGFGAAELRIEERPTPGEAAPHRKARREKTGAEGPIVTLPDPIEVMITGGDHVDPDTNWRWRMKAIHDYCPVEPTEARLRKIAGPVLPEPHADLLSWLLNSHADKPFKSLLDAADALGGPRGELNKRALRVEADAEQQGHAFSRQEGQVEQLLRVPAQLLGLAPAAGAQLDASARIEVERRLLDESEEFRTSPARLREEDLRLARMEVSAESRTAEEARVERLRQSHGEAPSIQEEVDALADWEARVEQARTELEEDRRSAAAAGGALDEFRPRAGAVRERISAARAEWWEQFHAAHSALELSNGWPAANIEGFLAAEKRALEAVEEAVAEGYEVRLRLTALETAYESAVSKVNTSRSFLGSCETERNQRRADLEAAQARLEIWRGTDELLRTAIEGNTPAEVEAQRAVVEQLKVTAGLFAAAGPFQQARTTLAAARRKHTDLTELGKLLRKEVIEVWNRLGEVMTEALQSETVRVRAGKIEILNDDGRWLDVADDVMLSKGRLRRAFLDLFIDKHPGDENVVVPEEILLLVDGAGRSEISGRAAAKRLRLLFERPVDEGEDITEPVVHWYAPPAPVAPAEEVAYA